jgi:4-amino-4-deoxy-L-arabinose transferase-like glycosyltransferase
LVRIFKRKNRRVIPKPAKQRTSAKADAGTAKKSAKAAKAKPAPKKVSKPGKPRTKKSRPSSSRRTGGHRPPVDWLTLLMGMLLGALSLAALLLAPDPRGLWEPWEAAWALAGLEMHQAGDWFQATLNGWGFTLRSPLSYWPLLISYDLFGYTDFAARLAGSAWGALLVAVIYSLAAGFKGRLAAAGAAIATMCCLTFWAASRACLVDMGMVAGLALVLDGLATAYRRGTGTVWRFWLGMALCFALGGIGAILAPLAAVILLGVLTRRMSWLGALFTWPGLAGSGLVSGGLVLLICLNNPEYWSYYLTLGPGEFEKYYLGPAYLLMGAFPLLCLLPWACNQWSRSEDATDSPTLLLVLWQGLIWLSAPLLNLGALALGLALWIAPAVCLGPALAGLALGGFKQESGAGLKWTLTGLSGLLLALAIAYPLIPMLIPSLGFADFGISLIALPCLAAGLAFAVQMFKRRGMAALAAPLAIIMVLGLGLLLAMHSLDKEHSLRRLVAVVHGELKAGDRLVCYGQYWPGLGFYAKRRVELASPRGFVLQKHLNIPSGAPRIIPNDALFIRLMQKRGTRFLVVALARDYERLSARSRDVPGLLIFEWARRGDWVLFSNRPL